MANSIIRRGLAIAGGLLLITGSMAAAQNATVGAMKIEGAWVREPPAAAKVAGAFMTITNTGSEPDRLIGGTAVVAGRLEVHEMSMVDGVMRMQQLQPGLEIKPGATVVLKPGSYHIMMMDLKGAPAAGSIVKGTLVFEKAGMVEIEYKVEPARAGGHGAGMHSGGAGKAAGTGAGANAH